MTESYDNDFLSRLQMLVELDTSPINSARDTLTGLPDWVYQQPWEMDQLSQFAIWRSLDLDTLIKNKVFYVPDDLPPQAYPKEYHDDNLGFINGSRVVYSGRVIFPIFDTNKKIAGLTGYDAFEEPKYLDSVNVGYKAKTTMFMGMENLESIYRDGKCAFVEGPVCKMRLDEAQLPGLSSLGSRLSPYMMMILRRFGRQGIVLPDSDAAGDTYAKSVKYGSPKTRVFRFTKAKDLDDTVKAHGTQVLDEIRDALAHPFGRYTYIK